MRPIKPKPLPKAVEKYLADAASVTGNMAGDFFSAHQCRAILAALEYERNRANAAGVRAKIAEQQALGYLNDEDKASFAKEIEAGGFDAFREPKPTEAAEGSRCFHTIKQAAGIVEESMPLREAAHWPNRLPQEHEALRGVREKGGGYMLTPEFRRAQTEAVVPKPRAKKS